MVSRPPITNNSRPCAMSMDLFRENKTLRCLEIFREFFPTNHREKDNFYLL